jgi:hypothetical protein
MRLYKYVSSKNAVLNMAKGSIKFTPINELNDPTELIPVMNEKAVRDSLTALRGNGYSDEQFQWLRHQAATLDLLAPEKKVLREPITLAEANLILTLPIYDNLTYMKQELFASINLMRSKVGILSLTERYDSFPMWAHYANNARGFVVQIENLGEPFSGDTTGSLNVLKKVDYQKEFVGMTFDPTTQDDLFFSKLEDWSYEKEWRVVTALNDCDCVTDPTQSCRNSASYSYLRNIDDKHITSVICGWQIADNDVACLRDELAQINPKIQVITTTLNGATIKLQAPMNSVEPPQ